MNIGTDTRRLSETIRFGALASSSGLEATAYKTGGQAEFLAVRLGTIFIGKRGLSSVGRAPQWH